MINDETTRRSALVCGIAAATVALLLWTTAAAGAETIGSGRNLRVVLWELPASRHEQLVGTYSEAITEALRTVVNRAGVVLCYGDRSGSTDSAFIEHCQNHAAAERGNPELDWTARVNVNAASDSRMIVIFSLSIDVHVDGKRQRKARSWLQAENLIAQIEVNTSRETTAESREFLVAQAIFDWIVGNITVGQWFESLATYPELLVESPEGSLSAATVSTSAPPTSRFVQGEPVEIAGSDDKRERRWNSERDAIADLLIDGEAAVARERARALLAEDDLPADLVQRVESLLAKAEAKLAAKPAAVEPAVEVAPDSQTEAMGTMPAPEPAAGDPAPVGAPPLDVTFQVRLASAGGGFRAGVEGRLRISVREIRFVPKNPVNAGAWSVTWPLLKQAGVAEGLWDVAYPLVIETIDGEKYFITEITQEGRYGDGREILETIEKGRQTERG